MSPTPLSRSGTYSLSVKNRGATVADAPVGSLAVTARRLLDYGHNAIREATNGKVAGWLYYGRNHTVWVA
jgi:hypothetical protein